MRVFITKYALTKGVYEIEAKVCESISPDMISEVKEGVCNNCFHGKGKNWHETRESAVERAKKMRDAKVAALKKQIKKLEAMEF